MSEFQNNNREKTQPFGSASNSPQRALHLNFFLNIKHTSFTTSLVVNYSVIGKQRVKSQYNHHRPYTKMKIHIPVHDNVITSIYDARQSNCVKEFEVRACQSSKFSSSLMAWSLLFTAYVLLDIYSTMRDITKVHCRTSEKNCDCFTSILQILVTANMWKYSMSICSI